LYERKSGEFHDGIENGYIEDSHIIDRESFLRVAYAIGGLASEARRTSSKQLFEKAAFDKVLTSSQKAPDILYGFLCLKRLNVIQRTFNKKPRNRYGTRQFGNALRYGKMAAVTAAHYALADMITPESIERLISSTIDDVLSRWIKFEKFAIRKKHNRDYFRKTRQTIETDFDGYYKGKTLNEDLISYFHSKA
jgi:hypothetical protein